MNNFGKLRWKSKMKCSHILVSVGDLHEAVADYTRAGFDVAYATDPAKSRHAHVWFPEGPIIELVCPPRRAALVTPLISTVMGPGAGRRMARWARSDEGFCDLALRVPDSRLEENLAALRTEGVQAGRIMRWTRTRPDGERTRFRFVYPRRHRLPFLVTPYEPPQHPERTDHPNGARAVTAVEIGVSPDDRQALTAMTADDPIHRVREHTVTGVLSLRLAGLDTDPDPDLLHGARILADAETTGDRQR